jgi:hypothetical protein
LQSELRHLQKVFMENWYPSTLIQKILFPQQKVKVKADLDTQDEIFYGYLVAPYDKLLNGPLKKLCKSLNIGFLNKRKINLGNLIAPKRPPTDLLHSKDCVYKIPCANPNALSLTLVN